jgi:hypothetical protein
LYIDYGFHLPLMVSVAIVAYTFLHLLRRASEKPGKVTCQADTTVRPYEVRS